MNEREVLERMRPIVEAGGPDWHGCLEDALSRVLYDASWIAWGNRLRESGKIPNWGSRHEVLSSEPVYKRLMRLAETDYQTLWGWNDHHAKVERLELIDKALAEL